MNKFKKDIVKGLIIALIGFLFCSFVLYETKDYIEIEVQYGGCSVYRKTGEADDYYEHFYFNYNGRDYHISNKTLSPRNAQKGEIVKIEIDPNNPDKIKDLSYMRYGIFAFLLGLAYSAWSWFMSLFYRDENRL